MHTSQMTEHAAGLCKRSSKEPDLSCTRCVASLPSPPACSGDAVPLQIPLFFYISWWLGLAFLHPVTRVLCLLLLRGLSSVTIRGKWKVFYKTSIKFPNAN